MRALLTLAAATMTILLATATLAAAEPADRAMSDATAAPLAYQPDGLLPLEGTPWRLSWYRWKGTERVPGPEVAARMTLTAGSLEASGGCTAFKGSYGSMGAAISFDLKRLKDNDCAEQTTLVQLAMVDGLRKAVRYAVSKGDDGQRLALVSANDTELLRFRIDDVGALESVGWQLVAYTVDGRREAVAPDLVGDLSFSAERSNDARRRSSGAVLGSTGCNGFGAEYFRAAGVISFGGLAVTDAPCPDALAELEQAMLEVFEATSASVSLPPDRLILRSTDSAAELEYRAVPALEGSTWLLASSADREPSGGIVTLKLQAGEAGGEGPCGPYRAVYVTDGVFVTFSHVSGAGDDTCAAVRDERRLVAALRAAVRVERDTRGGTPRLTLRDAQDARLIQFEYPFGSP